MLTALHIQNFAIVKELNLDFCSGMTAFTGETGAGKSIMIDALMLALGSRADASSVRTGADKCDISASFSYAKDSPPDRWLIDNAVVSEDGELILRRVLYAEGGSKSFINGQPFPLQKIREIGELLVHIHGQHQHQTLMQHATHRQQLDHYANHRHLLMEVEKAYQNSMKIRHELDELLNQKILHDRLHLLQFQLQELNELNVIEGEMSILHEEHQMLHHAKDYLLSIQNIEMLLQGDDGNGAILTSLYHILLQVQSLPKDSEHIKNAIELLQSARIQCEEAFSEIQAFSSQVQLDPQRLQTVENRISQVHAMARKYHVEASQLPALVERLSQELESIQGSEKRIEALQKAYVIASKDYEKAAMSLSNSRKAHAQKLADEITSCIQKLGMPKGYITIEITPQERMQSHGMDKIEYLVCTNPGMSPDTLNRIASGGELSRISLAIQMITAQRGSTPTLLFDEVDVGIGGATAALVGQMLRKLGERLQVFCVTHQAQVAASAHHHCVVSKFSDNEQTYTRILSLPEESAKVDEIARMLGGLTITDQTRSHARELLTEHSG